MSYLHFTRGVITHVRKPWRPTVRRAGLVTILHVVVYINDCIYYYSCQLKYKVLNLHTANFSRLISTDQLVSSEERNSAEMTIPGSCWLCIFVYANFKALLSSRIRRRILVHLAQFLYSIFLFYFSQDVVLTLVRQSTFAQNGYFKLVDVPNTPPTLLDLFYFLHSIIICCLFTYHCFLAFKQYYA